MKTVIIYYSKHGTTEKVAGIIGNYIGAETELISLKERCNPDIEPYDMVILGTSVYTGRPGRLMDKFCKRNGALLAKKTTGLFICCMNGEHEVEELANAFPEYLHKKSVAEAILGGEFLFDKMNFTERFITRRIARIYSSVSNLRYDAIREFAEKVK